jgi:hypothetical protein
MLVQLFKQPQKAKNFILIHYFQHTLIIDTLILATLDEPIVTNIKALLREYKDIFTWNYIDLKGIPPHIA